MHLAVIGTGYVGLVAGVGFANIGNDVTCVDVDASKIARLKRGEVPIYEPGLDTLLAANAQAGRLTFSTDIASAIRAAEVVIIAVGTPPAADGSADLSAVFAVAETIGQNLNGFKVVVTKSTVPVGTADRIEEIIRRYTEQPFGVASNPEFLKEGAAIEDFMKPDRVVIGSNNARALEVLRGLYTPLVRTSEDIHTMDARSAELTKYAANAMLATRISFMNDLAVLSEKLGADIERVRKAVGADPRVGPRFLYPGAGFGGSCFPKDISALLHIGRGVGHELEVVRAVESVNKRQKRLLFEKLRRHLDGALEGRTVAVWGLAFKPQTDDIRESPALVLIHELLEAGARVRAHDPEAMDNVRALLGDRITYCEDMYQAAEGADALALVTEWREYRQPDFARVKRLMRTPTLLDGRNIWESRELRALGFWYTGIGRP
ncbi:UDP-glucose/GDP-mannose dehydrogenase family protein [Archangium violaceum]|uniref:UDP-glucose dehydrogenase family protein n=1 Tax=Archangium violaceum TaxID=83451 RepID=UPI001952011A|nr:UDP-glucose/GDP-mannose dehydrogenase family protein [Archangium violaceum]QRO02145.1 UDP-glucose/GDP-mannose dehydrogenase family protein [Archangium violaceum]